jgi:thimet oligopeptidase
MIKRSLPAAGLHLILAALLLSAPIVSLRAANVAEVPGAGAAGPRGIPGAGAGLGAPSGLFSPGVSFQVSPRQIGEQFAAARTGMDAAVAKIVALPPEARTFENTVKALETASAVFSEQTQNLTFLGYVSPNPEVAAAAQALEVEAGKYNIALWSRPELYQAVKSFADKKETLDPKDARLLEAMMRGFKGSGHGLDAAAKDRLQKVQERLSELASVFESNINKDNGFMDMTAEQLKGLPDDFIQGLQRTDEGKYRVTLKTPDYMPFMKYSEDSEARKQLQLKYANRAVENLPLLSEALKLRDESAKILGYKSYPDLALDGRMAENPQKVWDFLNGLWPILRVQGEKELGALLELKKQDDPSATKINSWELGYYSNKLRKAKYDLDNEEVKKYFPVEKVVAGTMQVYQKVLGVTFTEVPNADKWHPEVQLYRINDAQDGREIGYFYLDLFPREGKYSHAAAFTIVQGRELEEGGYRKPVSAMVANLSKSVPGQPSLMPHADVETFFHEFGHLMHQTLTKAKYASFAGSATAQDFVEAPSQMLENFVWQREVLDMISGRYDTGEKLPDELFQKMLKTRNFNNGLSYLTQLAYAMIDMVYHTAVPQETTRIFNQMMELIGLMPVQPGTHSEASFGHLMGGYGAGYYGYLWSEVFADDIFTRFAKEGLFNPAVGMAWRTEVLERGSERPEIDSLRAFLGREPSNEAFMKKMQGEPSVDDAYWSLRRIVDERRAALQKLDVDGVGIDRAGGAISVRIAMWPEALEGRTEEEVKAAVRRIVPEIGNAPVRMVWLGVGA